MKLDEFRRLAEARGGDLNRWPDHLREEAAAIAGTSGGAAILVEAEELDRLLADAAPHIADMRVERAIHGVVTRLAQPQPARGGGLRAMMEGWFIPAAGFACAALIGALIAFADPIGIDQGDDDDARTLLSMIVDPETISQEIVR
jgi:hypothetical protein